MRTLNDITPEEWDSLREGTPKWDMNLVGDVGGTKHDGGKTRLDLITPEMLRGLADPLTFGAEKYADNNWREGLKYSRVLGAALRHLTLFCEGVNIDSESGLNHIDQAMLNLGFLVTFEREGRGSELDDLHGRNK